MVLSWCIVHRWLFLVLDCSFPWSTPLSRSRIGENWILHRDLKWPFALWRLFLGQRLLSLLPLGNIIGAYIGNSLYWLTFTLELGVLSALWSVHHSFNIENICKILVRIQRRVDWLQGLDRAWTIYMISLLGQTRLLLLWWVHISNIDVGSIVQIIWSQSASANILGQSWIGFRFIHVIAAVTPFFESNLALGASNILLIKFSRLRSLSMVHRLFSHFNL